MPPPLAADGCRVLVPYLRGYGPTRFLSAETPRSGEQAALGQDLLEFMDALGIARAALAGYDWGGRAACIVAALWPERVRGLVSCGGYNIQNIAASGEPASAAQEHRLWYQYYFHTERGRAGLTKNRRDVCRLLWRLWSPEWHFDEATFERSAAVVRQPRLRRRRDPVLPPSLRLRARRSRATPASRPSSPSSPRSPCRRSSCTAATTAWGRHRRRTARPVFHRPLPAAPAAGHRPQRAAGSAGRHRRRPARSDEGNDTMNIALVGATGNIGSRILDEALSRGHQVTGITRDPKKLSARNGLQARQGNTTDLTGFVRVLQGHDAAIVSVKWNENDIKRVLDAMRHSAASSVPVRGRRRQPFAQGRQTHFDYMAEKGVQPPTSKPAALAWPRSRR